MNVNELRIGNCLEYNGMIKSIYSIDKKGFVTFDTEEVVVGGYKYEQSPSLHIENFNPIPLTEERLLKFGFKPFCKDYSKKGIILHTRKRGYVLRKRVPDVKYVHQLQNLYFALTGQELTISQ